MQPRPGFKYDELGPYIEKDPDEDLDYTLNWNKPGDSYLGSDTIATVLSWTITSGITGHDQTSTTTTTTTWLAGGTDGVTYTVAVKIRTVGGRTVERSFRVVVTNNR